MKDCHGALVCTENFDTASNDCCPGGQHYKGGSRKDLVLVDAPLGAHVGL